MSAASDKIPKFDPKKVYLLRGATGEAISRALKTHEPKIVKGGGLEIASQTDQGTFLRAKKGGGGGDGSIDVADNDGGEVDNVSLIRFENTDPDTTDNLTVEDGGGGEAIVKFPTTRVTGAVNGVPSTLVIVTDGADWEPV